MIPIVQTYTQEHPDIGLIKKEITELLTLSVDDPKALNYSKYIDLDQMLALSVHRLDNKAVAFSSVYHNPLFGSAVRVLNRYFQHPDHRNPRIMPRSRRIDVPEVLTQQIAVAEEMGYDMVFVSRQGGSGAGKAFQKYIKRLDQHWEVSPYRHRVCVTDSSECYQWIMYHTMTKVDPYEILNTYISDEEYRDRFVI